MENTNENEKEEVKSEKILTLEEASKLLKERGAVVFMTKDIYKKDVEKHLAAEKETRNKERKAVRDVLASYGFTAEMKENLTFQEYLETAKEKATQVKKGDDAGLEARLAEKQKESDQLRANRAKMEKEFKALQEKEERTRKSLQELSSTMLLKPFVEELLKDKKFDSDYYKTLTEIDVMNKVKSQFRIGVDEEGRSFVTETIKVDGQETETEPLYDTEAIKKELLNYAHQKLEFLKQIPTADYAPAQQKPAPKTQTSLERTFSPIKNNGGLSSRDAWIEAVKAAGYEPQSDYAIKMRAQFGLEIAESDKQRLKLA